MTEDNLDEIKTDPVQKQIVGDLAQFVANQLDLKEMVVKGFLWRSLREWQITHGITHKQTEDGFGSSPIERKKQMAEILGLLEKQVIKVIKSEKASYVDKTMKMALERYEEKYANR